MILLISYLSPMEKKKLSFNNSTFSRINKAILKLSTPSTCASSSPTPYIYRQENSASLGNIFELQPATVLLESPAPTYIVKTPETRTITQVSTQKQPKVKKAPRSTQTYSLATPTLDYTSSITPSAPTTVIPALKSHPAIAGCMENHQNHQKSPTFVQEPSEPLIPKCFSWADDTEAIYTTSTISKKRPRDLACLRLLSTNPFSSLQGRHRQPWESICCINLRPQFHCHNTFQSSCFYLASSHPPWHLSQPLEPPIPVSLDWDQDPHLINLSIALQALGWARQ